MTALRHDLLLVPVGTTIASHPTQTSTLMQINSDQQLRFKVAVLQGIMSPPSTVQQMALMATALRALHKTEVLPRHSSQTTLPHHSLYNKAHLALYSEIQKCQQEAEVLTRMLGGGCGHVKTVPLLLPLEQISPVLWSSLSNFRINVYAMRPLVVLLRFSLDL